jgi:hypothetical protein
MSPPMVFLACMYLLFWTGTAVSSGGTTVPDVSRLPATLPNFPLSFGTVANPLPLPGGTPAVSPDPSPPPNLVPGRQWIHIMMSGTVDTFGAVKQRRLSEYLASFISRPPWAVAVVAVRAGSVWVTLQLKGYNTSVEEEAAIIQLEANCTRAAPAFGMLCDTFQVTPAGDETVVVPQAPGASVSIAAAVVGAVLASYLVLGCLVVLFRKQKRLDDPELPSRSLLSPDALLDGVPLEVVELESLQEPSCGRTSQQDPDGGRSGRNSSLSSHPDGPSSSMGAEPGSETADARSDIASSPGFRSRHGIRPRQTLPPPQDVNGSRWPAAGPGPSPAAPDPSAPAKDLADPSPLYNEDREDIDESGL